jgi:hypothetical protein
MESEGHGHVRALALVAGAATVAVLLAPESTGGEEPLLRFALAVPLVCLGFAWRPRVPRAVHDLSTLTFGVYVVHPSLAKAFATAFEVARWPGALHVAAVWLCSAAAVLALRRLPVKLTECWSGRAPAPVLAMPRREERRAA